LHSAAIKNHWNSTLRRQVALGQLPVLPSSSSSPTAACDNGQSKLKKRRTDRDGRCGSAKSESSPSKASPPETPESTGTKALRALDRLHIKGTPTPKRGKHCIALDELDTSERSDDDDEDQLSSHSTNALGCDLDECTMLLSPSSHAGGDNVEDQQQPTRPARSCTSVFARRKPKGISIRTMLDEPSGCAHTTDASTSLWTPGFAPAMEELFVMSSHTPNTANSSCETSGMAMSAHAHALHVASPRSCLGVGEMFSGASQSLVSRETGEMYALGAEPHGAMTAAEVASMLCTTPPQAPSSIGLQCLC
jgi:hypothetical protein